MAEEANGNGNGNGNTSPSALSLLGPLRRAFVLHYTGDCKGNAAKAAEAAGYKADKDESLRSQASRLLTNVNVIAAINEIYAAEGMTTGEVTASLCDIARNADISRFLAGWGGLNMDAIKADGRLVQEMAFSKAGPRIKLYSRLDALDKIARTLGMFKDELKHTGNITIEVDV